MTKDEYNNLIEKCYIDLYNASEGPDGQPGNYTVLRMLNGRDNIPYQLYYINEYKLHRIVKEYLEMIPKESQMDFVNEIYMGNAPSSSYMSWLREINKYNNAGKE